MSGPRPWRWQRRLIERLVPEGRRVAGELEELHALRVLRDGPIRAQIWHTRQLLGLLARLPALRRSAGRSIASVPSFSRGMLRARAGGLAGDVQVATRGLARSPGFAAAAVVSIAIGIAAVVTVFSVASGVLLRPFPAPDPERLVRIGLARDGDGFRSLSYAELEDIRHGVPALDGVVAHSPWPAVLTVDGRPVEQMLELVSGDYFDVLGVRPGPGRGFLPEEDAGTDGRSVVVLSHALWQRGWASDPAVVGSTVRLNGHPFTVVGVAPPGFEGSFRGIRIDAWAPLADRGTAAPGAPPPEDRAARGHMLVGRLAPGATRQALSAQLEALGDRLREAHPDVNEGVGYVAADAGGVHPFLARALATFLGLLLVLVGLVLLAACANVALLMLARGADRTREMAVRRSLGASRGRVVRLLLVEALAIGVAGASLGFAAAWRLTAAAHALLPPSSIPLAVDVTPDLRVAAFAAAALLLSVAAFGVAPILAITRVGPAAVLRGGASTASGTGADRSRFRLPGRRALVVLQVGVSVVLLVTSGLLVRSLRNATVLDPGFETVGQWVLSTEMQALDYGSDDGMVVWEALLDRARAVPGVEAAALALYVPMGDRGSSLRVAAGADRAAGIETGFNVVGGGYFETMGIRLVEGRGFLGSDRASAPAVVVVNETLARRLWPDGRAAVGRTLVVGEAGEPATVVGVAADSKYRALGEPPRPFLYRAFAQAYTPDMRLHVRVAGPAREPLDAVTRALHDLDPDLPAVVSPLEREMAFSLAPTRVAGVVLTISGAAALFLALTGLFGLLSWTVARRRREIGIRMALGAERRALGRTVVRDGLLLTGAGLVPGFLVASGVARLLGSVLYGVAPTDPLTLGTVGGLLLGVAALAAWLPARRASGVDPMRVLRED